MRFPVIKPDESRQASRSFRFFIRRVRMMLLVLSRDGSCLSRARVHCALCG